MLRGAHQQTGGAHDQVILIGHAFNWRQQTDFSVLTQFNGNRVAIVNKLKQRLQGVIPVSTLAGNV
ncbi:hypothetical protein D3C76_1391640 [compost metagenome]